MTRDELTRKVDEALASFDVAETVETARRYCRDAGIGQAQTELRDAIDLLEQRQGFRREAVVLERQAKEAYDVALGEAAWEAEASLIEEAGKTYVKHGERKILIGASDRGSWATKQAKKNRAVIAAAKSVAEARARTEAADDAIEISKRQIAACERQVDAAIAVLATLRRALPNPPTSTRSTTT